MICAICNHCEYEHNMSGCERTRGSFPLCGCCNPQPLGDMITHVQIGDREVKLDSPIPRHVAEQWIASTRLHMGLDPDTPAKRP